MSMKGNEELDEKAVENFREYLRIPTKLPNTNYDKCIEFLTKQAESLNLSIKIHRPHPDRPIVILTWVGIEPKKKSILLNSHMNVEPVVFEDKWTYPPFSAHIDKWGNIYGRGSQDTKCVGIQYLEAIRRLKADGKQCKRTIHISFVPNERYFVSGLELFVVTSEFEHMNVGFALDGGMASTNENFLLFNGEKSILIVQINCKTDDVDGSNCIVPNNTAGEKLSKIIERLMQIDLLEKRKYSELVALKIKSDEVTSVTLMNIWGDVLGDVNDVVSSEFHAIFKINLGSTTDHETFENIIDKVCKETGVKYFYQQRILQNKVTVLDDSNFYWQAFRDICSDIGLKLDIKMRPTSLGSDSRYLRERDIPVISFSPINNTRMRHHDYDEYINKQMFLQGIGIYYEIIGSIGNASEFYYG